MTTAGVAEAAELYLTLGRVSRLLRRCASPGELSPGAMSALATVVGDGPLRHGELATTEQVAAPTMSRIVAILEQAGYVVREPDPDDGRATRIAPTPAGVQLVTGVTSLRTRHLAAALGQLDPGQRDAVITGLAAVARGLAADGPRT